eukprot:g17939.t1
MPDSAPYPSTRLLCGHLFRSTEVGRPDKTDIHAAPAAVVMSQCSFCAISLSPSYGSLRCLSCGTGYVLCQGRACQQRGGGPSWHCSRCAVAARPPPVATHFACSFAGLSSSSSSRDPSFRALPLSTHVNPVFSPEPSPHSVLPARAAVRSAGSCDFCGAALTGYGQLQCLSCNGTYLLCPATRCTTLGGAAGGWRCRRCCSRSSAATYSRPSIHTPSPQPGSATQDTDNWSCPRCTFINLGRQGACSMCQEQRTTPQSHTPPRTPPGTLRLLRPLSPPARGLRVPITASSHPGGLAEAPSLAAAIAPHRGASYAADSQIQRPNSPQKQQKRDDKGQDKDLTCVVCLDGDRTHILLDCMHFCLCGDCASKKSDLRRCPLCRSYVSEIRRVYT